MFLISFQSFFSLYAFVQSYLLLRLGFIFASNLNNAKTLLSEKLADITAKVKIQTNSMPNFLDISKYTPQLKENIQKKIDEELAKNLPKELSKIRASALDFTVKTLRLALQSQELEANFTQLAENYENPMKNTIDTIHKNMEIINTQIGVCSSDYSHLMILVSKYLNNETDEEKNKTGEKKVEEETPAEPNVIKLINDKDVPQQKDEFFYHDQTMEVEKKNNEEENSKVKTNASQDEDEEELQKQRTLKKFQPVLQQLKSVIEPIEQEMKEREKKSLNEKGIAMPEEPEKKLSLESPGEEEGEWTYVSDRKKKRQNKKKEQDQNKKANKKNKYNEDREYLMSKEQINLFNRKPTEPLNIPAIAKGNEKIYGEEEAPDSNYVPRNDMIAILKAQAELNGTKKERGMNEEYFGDNEDSKNDVQEKFDEYKEDNKSKEEYYGDDQENDYTQENYDDANDASNIVETYIKQLPEDDESVYEDKSTVEAQNFQSKE
ncbi:hypothetical protein PVAND_001578 [Polypedilum vanderplanki]|uniref:Uncharacterized protein n=1 Tax=Polypedilum vanderplanki TaxID=319348 RepID=A0A9J6BNC7_POLVA|nr:hypothetical protein PVAND_001578 [Polypedilum vanderplanki]